MHTLLTFLKNCKTHFTRFCRGHETLSEAISNITKDIKKLLNSFSPKKDRADHKKAKQLLNKGKEAYNQRRFEDAEQAFRTAIVLDKEYALAYTYLGNALYKMGRYKEAVVYWGKAINLAPGSEAALKAEQNLHVFRKKRQEATDWIHDKLED